MSSFQSQRCDNWLSYQNCLLEWWIDNVLTITEDNSRSNNLIIAYLKNVIQI